MTGSGSGSSLPRTATVTSVPATYSSTMTFWPHAKATSRAWGSSAGLCTMLMPTLDPSPHGFTTHLSPTACPISSTDMDVGLASVTDLATASPARAYMALERDLSIAVALAATPEPV